MLRLLLKLALLAGIGGAVLANLDQETTRKLSSSIRNLAESVGRGGLPGGQEAASGMDKAAEALQPGPVQPPVVHERGAVAHGTAHPKAFYNKLPSECHWEKVIDPASGEVSCSVQERRQ